MKFRWQRRDSSHSEGCWIVIVLGFDFSAKSNFDNKQNPKTKWLEYLRQSASVVADFITIWALGRWEFWYQSTFYHIKKKNLNLRPRSGEFSEWAFCQRTGEVLDPDDQVLLHIVVFFSKVENKRTSQANQNNGNWLSSGCRSCTPGDICMKLNFSPLPQVATLGAFCLVVEVGGEGFVDSIQNELYLRNSVFVNGY